MAALLYQRMGIRLENEKGYLVEARFRRIYEHMGLGSIGEFVAHLRNGCPEPLLNEAMNAMTTNETYFFRDQPPFDALREKVLPAILKSRRLDAPSISGPPPAAPSRSLTASPSQ